MEETGEEIGPSPCYRGTEEENEDFYSDKLSQLLTSALSI